MPANKVDHLKLKNYIERIKCFLITFLKAIVETSRCKSTNIGAVYTDLIKKEISVTTKKKKGRLTIDRHPLIDLRYASIQRRMEILQQFANLKLNFIVLTKALYVNLRKRMVNL